MKEYLKKLVFRPLKRVLVELGLVKKSVGIKPKMSTSITDNGVYPNFCNKASLETAEFINFRRNSTLVWALEHVNFEVGQRYFDEIRKATPDLIQDIELFKANDTYGNPYTYDYGGIGKISPVTLRYIKVLSDLNIHFKSLDNLDICEIGVGYGGQCRVINAASSPKRYTLVDIKPALRLSQKYLDNFILNAVIDYKTMNELDAGSYDLVISNYAFTELPRSIQQVYLKKIILNSRNGYITYNEITPEHFDSYKRDELLKLIPNSFMMEEIPQTNPKNCIIVWREGS